MGVQVNAESLLADGDDDDSTRDYWSGVGKFSPPPPFHLPDEAPGKEAISLHCLGLIRVKYWRYITRVIKGLTRMIRLVTRASPGG